MKPANCQPSPGPPKLAESSGSEQEATDHGEAREP